MNATDENKLYARYLAARFAAEHMPAPPWPADPDHLAAAHAAHVLGCACRGRSLEDLPAAPEVAARVAALLGATSSSSSGSSSPAKPSVGWSLAAQQLLRSAHDFAEALLAAALAGDRPPNALFEVRAGVAHGFTGSGATPADLRSAADAHFADAAEPAAKVGA